MHSVLLTLMCSDEVKLAFQNSLTDILNSCASITERSKHRCDAILLVGGYSDSAYLRSTLREKFAASGIHLITAEEGKYVWNPSAHSVVHLTSLVATRRPQ